MTIPQDQTARDLILAIGNSESLTGSLSPFPEPFDDLGAVDEIGFGLCDSGRRVMLTLFSPTKKLQLGSVTLEDFCKAGTNLLRALAERAAE